MWLAESTLGVNPVDSGFYVACAGQRARTQALEVVANNLASLTTTGYSSSQVDKRKVGKLAIAIQVAFPAISGGACCAAKAFRRHRTDRRSLSFYLGLVNSVWWGSSRILRVSGGTEKRNGVCGPSASTVPSKRFPRSVAA